MLGNSKIPCKMSKKGLKELMELEPPKASKACPTPKEPKQSKAKESPATKVRLLSEEGLGESVLNRLRLIPAHEWTSEDRFGASFQKLILGVTSSFPSFKFPTIAAATTKHQVLTRALNTFGQLRLRGRLATWTAIAVVKGSGDKPMGLHAHPNDQGWLSGVITLGDYTGGEFFVESGMPCTPDPLKCGDPCVKHMSDGTAVFGHALNAFQGVVFQGTKIHGPLQWHGERYALVFYSRFTAANTSTHIREELLRLKFPL